PLVQAGTASGLPLVPSVLGPSALTRVCIYALGRAPEGLTAAALASALPSDLPMATGAAKVREVLRTHRCFFYLPKGRWQLGKPARLRQPLLAIPLDHPTHSRLLDVGGIRTTAPIAGQGYPSESCDECPGPEGRASGEPWP